MCTKTLLPSTQDISKCEVLFDLQSSCMQYNILAGADRWLSQSWCCKDLIWAPKKHVESSLCLRITSLNTCFFLKDFKMFSIQGWSDPRPIWSSATTTSLFLSVPVQLAILCLESEVLVGRGPCGLPLLSLCLLPVCQFSFFFFFFWAAGEVLYFSASMIFCCLRSTAFTTQPARSWIHLSHWANASQGIHTHTHTLCQLYTLIHSYIHTCTHAHIFELCLINTLTGELRFYFTLLF